MKHFLLLSVLLVLNANVSYGCSEDGSSGFLPENDMYIPAHVKRMGGISEKEFNAVIDRAEVIYSPIVSQMGGKLTINRKWNDGTVNANASRLFSTWKVNMYGGLARHRSITPDGFALVLCHELGHHLGGAPKTGGLLGLNKWASNEGQADYYATLKCLRQIFLNDDNAAVVSRLSVPEYVVNSCSKAHPNQIDRNICIRNAMAGASVAGLFADLRNAPAGNFHTPDLNVVSRTDHAHPAHQCRLDTYFQGALCEKDVSEEVSQKDEVQGTCHHSTGHSLGLRPRCWFKPRN